MPACRDCYWFQNKRRAGRVERSCKELGETADGATCDRFLDALKPGQSHSAWAEEQIGALSNIRYRDLFHEILAEGFALEQDSKLAIAAIRAQLQTQGASVTLEGTEFERASMRLIDIYKVYRLACVLGLGRFADEIISAEIQRRFQQRPASPQQMAVMKPGREG